VSEAASKASHAIFPGFRLAHFSLLLKDSLVFVSCCARQRGYRYFALLFPRFATDRAAFQFQFPVSQQLHLCGFTLWVVAVADLKGTWMEACILHLSVWTGGFAIRFDSPAGWIGFASASQLREFFSVNDSMMCAFPCPFVARVCRDMLREPRRPAGASYPTYSSGFGASRFHPRCPRYLCYHSCISPSSSSAALASCLPCIKSSFFILVK